jgi:hypothetical protein
MNHESPSEDGMRHLARVIGIAVFAIAWPAVAGAQTRDPRIELGVHLTSAVSSEFDRSDTGVGGRLSWHPADLIGVEGEFSVYPSDFPDDPAFSRSRVEGLFGVTVGANLNRLRPFAKVRPGFLTYREAPEPFPCILIFPPPLACALAAGDTIFALDIGGGLEVFTSPRTFLRFDAGDRLLRYPGPVFRDGSAEEDAFFSHDFRFAVGGGLRF